MAGLVIETPSELAAQAVAAERARVRAVASDPEVEGREAAALAMLADDELAAVPAAGLVRMLATSPREAMTRQEAQAAAEAAARAEMQAAIAETGNSGIDCSGSSPAAFDDSARVWDRAQSRAGVGGAK